jgi:signal peptidase I
MPVVFLIPDFFTETANRQKAFKIVNSLRQLSFLLLNNVYQNSNKSKNDNPYNQIDYYKNKPLIFIPQKNKIHTDNGE